MDREVLREIWHGKLPLCFKMNLDDVDGMHRPEPYYMMVSRITYFPLVLDRVVKYFNRFLGQNKQAINDMWLSYEEQPIKWQHPIGLSRDLLSSTYDLPWRLILHFSEFPKDLVRCNTKASIETNFTSAIKEADELKHRGIVIKNMVKKDHSLLWSSLVNNKFDQFWTINQRLMDKTDNELFRFIPFRLYFPDYTYVQKVIRPCTTERQIFQSSEKLSPTSSVASHIPVVHEFDAEIVMKKLHKCSHTKSATSEETTKISPEHRCSTMLDLIRISFLNRDDLLLQPEEKVDDEGHEKGADNASMREQQGLEANIDELIDTKSFRYRFVSHGIEIPFDTPLQWLSEHFSYPDNFLHICAVIKDEMR